jgi:hypothetical protein
MKPNKLLSATRHGMSLHSWFQPPLVLALGVVVLVFEKSVYTGMTEVEVDQFVCLACQAQHLQAISGFSSRRGLRIHITKSKNAKCVTEWSKIKVKTRPGDVIAGG